MNQGATREMALRVIRRLRQEGYAALLAGGCVRDMLLGRRPTDYDVATDAQPHEVSGLFRRVLMVGAKFGVAMVMFGDRAVEVATFRSDVSYSDGRRPDKVVFSDARADAQRRDFTINGMFYDPIGREVLDYVGGQDDLKARVIRAIGQPRQRFEEDYLRMLRAVRFAARLEFGIDPATAWAVKQRAEKIRQISGERIREELEKIGAHSGHSRAMRLLAELDLARPVLGEPAAEAETYAAAMNRLEHLGRRCEPAMFFAALLAQTPIQQVRKRLRHWGTSNQLRDRVCWLIENLPRWPESPTMELAELKTLAACDAWAMLRTLWRAEERRNTGRDRVARRLTQRLNRIDPEAINPPPLIGGAELMQLGCEPGPGMGQLLTRIRRMQLNEEIHTRAEAREVAEKAIRQ